MSSKRPEHQAPPELVLLILDSLTNEDDGYISTWMGIFRYKTFISKFYSYDEARKYTQNTRMMEIQNNMTERALELLALPDHPCLLLDLGCGSGLSGQVLEEQGHAWIGLDISQAMLDVAKEREVEGDLILSDLGQGIPFRAGAFDGAVSISALQWLCNADKTAHHPAKRLLQFFTTLYAALSRSARVVMQFYPENNEQSELITAQATRAGFYGGVVVDFPNSTKAKKFFLVLMTGGIASLPQGLGDESSASSVFTKKRDKYAKLKGKNMKSRTEWILEKKERRRRQGKDTREDSKYTGRKRSGRF